MNWFITDLDQTTIYITDTWREWYIPKFRISMTIDGDDLILRWNDRERGAGGDERVLTLDYKDVVDTYSGYIDNPTSAADLMLQIDAMIISGWTNIGSGGDTLLNFGDIMSHNGTSDEIFPLGTNEYVHIVNTSEPTGHQYVPKSDIIAGGLTANDTESLDLTLTGAVLTGRVKKINLPPVSASQYNPLDNTTAHFNNTGILAQNAAANLRSIYPPAGVLMGVHIDMTATSTTGSGENVSLYVRVNDTTDYLIATVGSTALVRVFENLAMNGGAGIAFNGTTDFYCYKIQNPLNYVTNPSAVGFQGHTIYYIT